MSLYNQIIKHEKKFTGAVPIKYLFLPSETPCDKLVVVFSAFSGTEGVGKSAFYNYPKWLINTDINRLFILDNHGGSPCYYLGKEGMLEYDSTTIALITFIANKNNISFSNITSIGSSKGGTAALYFGMKYNFGNVIAGGLQTKVGTYLYNNGSFTRFGVLKHITGSFTEKGKDILDGFYDDFFKKAEGTPNISIHVGEGDHHYHDHVKPLLEVLDNRNLNYTLHLGEYTSHADLAKHFPVYMISELESITGIPSINPNIEKQALAQ